MYIYCSTSIYVPGTYQYIRTRYVHLLIPPLFDVVLLGSFSNVPLILYRIVVRPDSRTDRSIDRPIYRAADQSTDRRRLRRLSIPCINSTGHLLTCWYHTAPRSAVKHFASVHTYLAVPIHNGIEPTDRHRPTDPPAGRPTDRPTNLPTSHPYLPSSQVPICRPTYRPTRIPTDRSAGPFADVPYYRPTDRRRMVQTIGMRQTPSLNDTQKKQVTPLAFLHAAGHLCMLGVLRTGSLAITHAFQVQQTNSQWTTRRCINEGEGRVAV